MRSMFLQRIWLAAAVLMFSLPAAFADQAQYACSRDRYVDINTGIDAPGRGDAAHPWKTIPYADHSGRLIAGDCVHVAAGVYPQNGTWNVTASGNANSPTGYIAWIGAANHATKIQAQGGAGGYLIGFNANYVVIDGFDVAGVSPEDYAIGANPSPGGVGHHIQILRNWIHDSGGGGIGLNRTDYRNIEYNVVWNTSCCSTLHESGVSLWEPAAISGVTPALATDQAPFHIIVRYNIIHDNKEGPAITGHTDGNGIILDWW